MWTDQSREESWSRDSLQAAKLSSIPQVLKLLADNILKDTWPSQQAPFAQKDRGHDLGSPLLLDPHHLEFDKGPRPPHLVFGWTLTAETDSECDALTAF